MNAGGGSTFAKGLNFLFKVILICYSTASLFRELFWSTKLGIRDF